MRSAAVIVIVVAWGFVGTDVSAAEADSVRADSASARRAACARGFPLYRCQRFWITEFGRNFELQSRHGYAGQHESPHIYMFDLGYMYNITARSAVGAGVFQGWGQDYERGGIKLRYRRWLLTERGHPAQLALDLTGGLILWSDTDFGYASAPSTEDNPFPRSFAVGMRSPSLIVTAGLSLADYVSLHVQTEILRTQYVEAGHPDDDPATEVVTYAGARLGSGLGVAGAVAFVVLLAIALSQNGD